MECSTDVLEGTELEVKRGCTWEKFGCTVLENKCELYLKWNIGVLGGSRGLLYLRLSIHAL